MTSDQVADFSARIGDRVRELEAWKAASVIHLYVDAKSNEVQTRPLIQLALEQRRRIIVPVLSHTGRPPLLHAELSGLEELKEGPFGLLQPVLETVTDDLPQPDLVGVPGLTFDRRGGRLGWGRGFYDHFLSGVEGPKVGVCYELQVVPQVPMDDHDVHVDVVVTERHTYHVN